MGPRRLDPGMALLPLRLFLGVTFVYAGDQKLSDPGFLHAGASTYIGTQLQNFAHGTPGGFLLRAFALPHPAIAGVGVALVEIVVGLLVVVGLATRPAAAVGMGLNLILFLTNSWHTSPYFLGSDIVFVFAWLPFVLTGASGQPALDHALDRWAVAGAPWSQRPGRLAARWDERLSERGVQTVGRAEPRGRPGASGQQLTRRAVLAQALGLTGLGALVIAGTSALSKGSYRSPAGALGGAARGGGNHRTARAQGRARRSGVPAGAIELGPAARLPAGTGATYRDPATGQPDIVIREPAGGLRAFSAVCTHAGCTVGYQGGQIVCPCHGGVYNAENGAVESGPPPQGLTPRKVLERGGKIYALPS